MLAMLQKSVSCAADESLTLQINSEQLEKLISSHYPADGAGAAVLIRSKGKTVFKQAFGQINIEHQVPATTAMKFNIGSITKQFTAVLALMLVEERTLNLDSDISTYFPEYKFALESKITIRQLLGHTAGIPDAEGQNGFNHHGTDIAELDEILAFIKDKPLLFKPGSQFRYSNSGYLLVQKIICSITGKSFETLIREKIFEPLNMRNSSIYDFYKVIPGYSKGYEISDNGTNKIIHAKPVRPGMEGAGSIITTVDDLAIWYDAIQNNKLISHQSKQIAFTSQKLNDGRTTKYGLGWRSTHVGPFKSIEHGGNNHGTEAYAMLIPDHDLQIMILTNLNRSYPERLVLQLASHLLNVSLPNQTLAVKPNHLNQLAGQYRHADGSTRKIFVKNNVLYSQRTGGNAFPLVSIGKDKFLFKGFLDNELQFHRNKQNQITQLVLSFRTQPDEIAKPVN